MILIVDSFFTGSHQYWGKELKKRLPFGELLTLSGKFWKWRMEAGAIELAEKFKKLNKKAQLYHCNRHGKYPSVLCLCRNYNRPNTMYNVFS